MKILDGLRTEFSAFWQKMREFHPWTYRTLKTKLRWYESTNEGLPDGVGKTGG